MPDASTLATDLAGIRLRSPVILAAGTAGTLDGMADVLDLSRVGAVVTKSITRLAREGNPTWRILECKVGMLNAIGLANVGLDRFLAEKVPLLQKMPCPVVVISESLAAELYPGQDALGRNMSEDAEPGGEPVRERRVVGVVKDYRQDGEYMWPQHYVFVRVRLDDPRAAPPDHFMVQVSPGVVLDASWAIGEPRPSVLFR